jgi:hypothetical protein
MTIGLDQVAAFQMNLPGGSPTAAQLDLFDLRLDAGGVPTILNWSMSSETMNLARLFYRTTTSRSQSPALTRTAARRSATSGANQRTRSPHVPEPSSIAILSIAAFMGALSPRSWIRRGGLRPGGSYHCSYDGQNLYGQTYIQCAIIGTAARRPRCSLTTRYVLTARRLRLSPARADSGALHRLRNNPKREFRRRFVAKCDPRRAPRRQNDKYFVACAAKSAAFSRVRYQFRRQNAPILSPKKAFHICTRQLSAVAPGSRRVGAAHPPFTVALRTAGSVMPPSTRTKVGCEHPTYLANS